MAPVYLGGQFVRDSTVLLTSPKAYQKSVELLDQCIEMIKIRWNLTRWRQDEDVPGSIAQLETIRDNYKARITSLSFRANAAQRARSL
ncbi:hypothetical protein FRB91_001866 [Serendipita sp. 411]|nr:hypothetical protein FRB91_001866 [Serendipita sp. 411]